MVLKAMMILAIGKKRPFKSNRVKLNGFTMMELMVVTALLALLLLIAIPSLNSMGNVALNSSISQIRSTIKSVYAKSILTAKTMRIVFDLNSREYWIESSVNDDKLDLAGIDVDLDDEIVFEKDFAKNKEQEADNLVNFKALSGEDGKKQKLKDDINFFGIWIDYAKKMVKKGKISLYFFPTGYTQEAQISLQFKDNQKSAKTIFVEPLTAEVFIKSGMAKIDE